MELFFSKFDDEFMEACLVAGMFPSIDIASTGTRYYSVRGYIESHRVSDHSKRKLRNGIREVNKRDPLDDISDLIDIMAFFLSMQDLEKMIYLLNSED